MSTQIYKSETVSRSHKALIVPLTYMKGYLQSKENNMSRRGRRRLSVISDLCLLLSGDSGGGVDACPVP